MKRTHQAAALLFLIASLLAIPSRALEEPAHPLPQRGCLPAASLSTALVLQRSLSRRHESFLRQRLIGKLATPDVSVIVLAAGVLLLFVECNVPGAVVPGALGLLLVLSAVYGLSLGTLRPVAVVVLLAAGALLALAAKAPTPGLLAFAGTGGLIYGLWNLVVPTSSSQGVRPAVAACAGLVLGPSAAMLGRIAERARRNKMLLASGSPVVATGNGNRFPKPPRQRENKGLPE